MREAVKRAVAFQRDLAIEEDREARAAIEAAGCEIAELTAGEHAQFRAAVAPLLERGAQHIRQEDVRVGGRELKGCFAHEAASSSGRNSKCIVSKWYHLPPQMKPCFSKIATISSGMRLR